MVAIVCHKDRFQGRRRAPVAKARHESKGLRLLTLNQGALVETLIQLSGFRQYDMAESVLASCEREQLQQLLIVSGRAFSTRMTYSLEKQLKRSRDAAYTAKKTPVAALIGVLNAWCAEGRRSAIRCVLGQLQESDLVALTQQVELDREVYSMLREYTLQL